MTTEQTTDLDYASDVVILDGDDPGVYLCQDDALMLAQAIERGNSVIPDMRLYKLATLLRSCAGDLDEALHLRADVA